MSIDEALHIRTEGDVVIAALSGEIDLSNAGAIGALVAGAIANDATGVVMDLTGTTYLDSSGVHLIFDLNERLTARQQRLVLAVPEDARIRRILDLVNVAAVVPVVPAVGEAVAAAREAPRAE